MSATAADSLRPWFERQPERLEWELAQFAERGLKATQRMGLADGRHAEDLVIQTEVVFRGQPVRVEVCFPFDYPDEGPTLYGPLGLLDRHQQPRQGNFCWAEDADRSWQPERDAAQLVAEPLQWMLDDIEAGRDIVRAGEADMPEPLTGLLAFSTEGVVVVPDPFFDKNLPADEGTLTLAGKGSRHILERAGGLGSPDPALGERYFPGSSSEDGYWLALDPTPSAVVLSDERTLLKLIADTAPRALGRLARRLKEKKRLRVAECWVGLTFIEEGPLRGESRRNWVFARLQMTDQGDQHLGAFIRTQALTPGERLRRIPELDGLAASRVLLIGAGSLGSPLCGELAKAGVGHVDIVDPDHLDVNNSVRHVLGPRLAGSNKALLTAFEANELNPFVSVEAHPYTVGGGADHAERLTELVNQAGVVVDTTGSDAVARILQRYCDEAEKLLVLAGLSAGSYGGELAIFRPAGPCLECLVRAQADGDVPEPAAAPPQPGVTPVGCSHPAFSGAGFDATALAALAARAVVQTLGTSKYPNAGFDWAIVNFRDDPRWESGHLAKHPKCSRCA